MSACFNCLRTLPSGDVHRVVQDEALTERMTPTRRHSHVGLMLVVLSVPPPREVHHGVQDETLAVRMTLYQVTLLWPLHVAFHKNICGMRSQLSVLPPGEVHRGVQDETLVDCRIL